MKSKPNVLESEPDVFNRKCLNSDSYVVLLEKNKGQVFSTISNCFLLV